MRDMALQRFQKALEAITSLGDPVRRKLYEAVSAADAPASRNDLAKITGVARPLVAYHLDRLVKDGLLDTRFERQSGRVGPGAGRPAKLYFRPKAPVRIALPARDSEAAAQLLLETVARSKDGDTRATLDELARESGTDLARKERQTASESDAEVMARLLAERGYEPRSEATGAVWLRNCVFDELANKQRQLVCGMNLSIIEGMLDVLPHAGLEAKLEPREGRCCVILSPISDGGTQ